MVPHGENIDIVHALDSAFAADSVQVLNRRMDLATDTTVIELQVAYQTVSPAAAALESPVAVPTEIGRVDYFV